jgi:murein DD-endopeptidase MepM/ murein hydrolase activator NlpD
MRSAILSEKPYRPRHRRRRRRWLLALASIPSLGVVAAFGIAPDTSIERIERREVAQAVLLTVADAIQPGDSDTYWREEAILRGDTVASLLARLQVDDPEALAYLHSTRSARPLYQLVPGRSLRAVTTGEGRLLSLRYAKGDSTELVVRREGEGFLTAEEQIATESQQVIAAGMIETSLFAATDRAGLSDAVAVQLADIFSSEIDFHRDLQPGDRFSVVYEALFAGGEFLRAGRILAAEFTNEGRTYRAVYFQDPHGRGGYYTPDGKNLRKAFLRSPLEFSRITSGFTRARLHPVLKIWRAHKGVDYGAPVGTRVRATADGVVEFAGQRGSYGKVIVLRHPNGHSTLYAHLSGFAKGLRAGQRISQGDPIGSVGMTGMTSGPHLHYEFLVNGVHKNPLGLGIPAGSPVGREMRSTFERAARPLLERLDLIRDANLATVS